MSNTSAKVFGHGRPVIGPGGLPPVIQMPPTEGRFLGKSTEYKTTYDPNLLQPVDRQDNRTAIGISGDLPFVGCDVWNAYEVSCLAQNGAPVCGYAKIKYPANSKFIVESKSLKLYLNSFNMTRLGGSNDCVSAVRRTLRDKIEEDLSYALQCPVCVSVFSPDVVQPHGKPISSSISYITCLEDITNPLGFETAFAYNEDPSILKLEDRAGDYIPTFRRYYSELLRSNCKVTHQPDWGTVYISYNSSKVLNEESLMRYIISFRGENHFHEEICETIYKRLKDLLEPSTLCVSCFYTRRGGIDINPIRASHERLIEEDLSQYVNMNTPCVKLSRQ